MKRQNIPAVINRPALPVIERNPRGTQRGPLLFIAILILGWMLAQAISSGPFDANWFASKSFRIEDVALRPLAQSGQLVWTVSGKLINTTKRTESAPDLQVELVRVDDSVAAQRVIDLRAQIVPGQSAIAFKSQLTTALGEAVSARVTPLKAGSHEQ